MSETEAMRVVIVGGGYLGAMAALLFSRRDNFQVTLIEKEARLGGLYNSAWIEDDYYFDFGSRAILATGAAELDELLFSILPDKEYPKSTENLKEFSFQRGKLREYSNCLDARVLPPSLYLRGKQELLAIDPDTVVGQKFDDLEARVLATYGPTLSVNLIAPVMEKLTGLPMARLDPEALRLHALHRIIIADQHESKHLKSLSEFNDARIAFAQFDDNQSTLIKTYPQTAGLDDFGQRIQTHLESASNVDLALEQSIVAVERDGARIRAVTLGNDQRVVCDQVLWTIPGIFLAKMLNLEVAGIKPPVFRNTVLAHYIFSGSLNTQAYYVYNYDREFLTYRASFYGNFTQGKRPLHTATVEVLYDAAEPDLAQIQSAVFEELIVMGCISADSAIVKANMQVCRNSIPTFSTEFPSGQAGIAHTINEIVENVHFLGRANGEHHSAPLVQSVHRLFLSMVRKQH